MVSRAMHRPNTRRQSGVVLLLFLFLAIVASASVLVGRLDSVASVRLDYDRKTNLALAAGKEALLGWAISNPNLLGSLPWPDRRDDPNGFDGLSDCSNGPFQYRFLIGRFPTLGSSAPCLGMPGLDFELRDGAGEPLWYAVSRNLVRDYNAVVLPNNPNINSNWDLAPYPWLTVWDQNGLAVVGADGVTPARVAFVVIAPGPALGGQDRSAVAPAIGNYLDSVTIGPTTFDNADGDGCLDNAAPCAPNSSQEDFIQGAVRPTFNDRLVYVTIDEMVRYLERRVVQEVRNCLDAYAAASGGKYPWPAQLAPVDYVGDPNVRFGRIPVPTGVPLSLNITHPVTLVPDPGMQTTWPAGCFTWPYWVNWQDSVFYAVDSQFVPWAAAAVPSGALTLDAAAPPPPAVVLSAGVRVALQAARTGAGQGLISNYLENDNVPFPDLPPGGVPPFDESFVTNATIAPNPLVFNDIGCATTLPGGVPSPCR